MSSEDADAAAGAAAARQNALACQELNFFCQEFNIFARDKTLLMVDSYFILHSLKSHLRAGIKETSETFKL